MTPYVHNTGARLKALHEMRGSAQTTCGNTLAYIA